LCWNRRGKDWTADWRNTYFVLEPPWQGLNSWLEKYLLCVGTTARIEQLIGEILTLCWNRGKDWTADWRSTYFVLEPRQGLNSWLEKYLLCVGTAARIEQLIGEVPTLCWNRGKDWTADWRSTYSVLEPRQGLNSCLEKYLLCVGTAAARIEQLIGEVLTLCWNRRGKDWTADWRSTYFVLEPPRHGLNSWLEKYCVAAPAKAPAIPEQGYITSGFNDAYFA
jgi:hypothetical protein